MQEGRGWCLSSQEEQIFYNDMSPEEQKKWISRLLPHSLKSFLEPATYECWHDMPSAYIFCDQDQAIPLAVQESFAQTLIDPTLYHIDASHSPFLSKPEEVVSGLKVALEAALVKNEIT